MTKQRRLLPPRQRQVLQLAAGGASNGEIAAAMGITHHTAKNHLVDVARKYGLRNGRTALVMEAIRRGDIDELLAYRDVEGRRRVKE